MVLYCNLGISDALSRSFLALRGNLDAPAVLDDHTQILGLIEQVCTNHLSRFDQHISKARDCLDQMSLKA